MLALIAWFKLEAFYVPLPFVGVSLPIQPFGVLVAIGIVVGSRVADWRARRSGVPGETIRECVALTVPLGLLGGALLNVLWYEPDKAIAIGRAVRSWFSEGPSSPLPYPGLSSFGGFVCAAAAGIWFRQRRRVSLLVMADLSCFAFPFGWLFGRTGCFVVHDHPGAVSDFFLAVDDYYGAGLPRHDLGLYEVLWSALMIPLLLLLGRRARPWGFYTALVTLAYAPMRFGLDFLRASLAEGGDVRYFGLTPAQYAALGMSLVGVAVALRVARGTATPLWLDGEAREGQAAAEPALALHGSQR